MTDERADNRNSVRCVSSESKVEEIMESHRRRIALAAFVLTVTASAGCQSADETRRGGDSRSVSEPTVTPRLHQTSEPHKEPTHQQPSTTYEVMAASALSAADVAAVRTFVDFAARPGPDTLREVPFGSGQVLVGFGSKVEHMLTPEELIDPQAWVVTDADSGGTTSPLFVISNSIRRNFTSTFSANLGRTPVCAEPVPTNIMNGRVISVEPPYPEKPACADMFRIDLYLNANSAITGVTVTVGGL